jgi:hypothetical protein
MRKSVIILVTGTLVASVAFLMVFDPSAESELQTSPAPAPSGMTRARQTDVQPAGDSPSAQSTESPKTQLAPADERGGVPASIPIPREFEMVSPDKIYWHRDTWRRLHARLEREPVDPSWSRSAEEMFMRAIASNPEIARRGTPTVNCRSTLCEMQMVIYGGDSNEHKWNEYLNPVLKKMMDANFKYEDLSTAQEGAVMTIAFILSRNDRSISR